jgi:aminoglycoside phosphotransferase (APT) family kinase protein
MVFSSPRLASALRQAGWRPQGAGVQVESYSNEVWLFDDVAVRMCWRGDRQRLIREAAVLRALAGRLACPEVLAVGGDGELSWMLTRRLAGQSLHSAWPHLDRRARQAAVEALGHLLGTLHQTPFDDATRDLLMRRDVPADDTIDEIVGADLNPLPVARALRLVPAVRELPLVDPDVIDAAQALLIRLPDPLAVPRAGTIVHGDAHFDNVLWHENGSITLLDFECVRLGPADLELEAFVKFDYELAAEEADLYRDVPVWLSNAYPGLFAHPQLKERLLLYELAFCLRHLLLWPPPASSASLPHGHPYRRLAAAVAGAPPSTAWLAVMRTQ